MRMPPAARRWPWATAVQRGEVGLLLREGGIEEDEIELFALGQLCQRAFDGEGEHGGLRGDSQCGDIFAQAGRAGCAFSTSVTWRRTATHRLQPDAAAAGIEIEHAGAGEVRGEDVEERFAHHPRGGPRGFAFRRFQGRP